MSRQQRGVDWDPKHVTSFPAPTPGRGAQRNAPPRHEEEDDNESIGEELVEGEMHEDDMDDRIGDEAREGSPTPIECHLQERRLHHMFGSKKYKKNSQTRDVWFSARVSARSLQGGGGIVVPISNAAAMRFRKTYSKSQGSSSVEVVVGDIVRSQVTEIRILEFYNPSPFDIAPVPKSLPNERNTAPQILSAHSGSNFTFIMTRESKETYTSYKDAQNLLFENLDVLSDEHLFQWGNVKPEDLDVGIHAVQGSNQSMLEVEKNKILADIIRVHSDRLERMYEGFSYDDLRESVERDMSLGKTPSILLPNDIIADLKNTAIDRGLLPIQKSTTNLGDLGFLFANPNSDDGSWKSVERELAEDYGLEPGDDDMTGRRWRVSFKARISAIVAGTQSGDEEDSS